MPWEERVDYFIQAGGIMPTKEYDRNKGCLNSIKRNCGKGI